MTGTAQQPLHLSRPVFLLDFDESLQFAKMMSVAQGVQHPLHRVVGLPVIVDDNAGDIRQQAAALGTHTIESQQRGGRHMQPLRLAADAEAGLIHVFYGRARHEIAHRFSKAPKTFGASVAHSGDRRGGELHAEEIGHQFGEAIFRQQLIVQQIDHEGGDSGAVLHGRVDAIWKRSPRFRAAGGASAIVRAMFGDDEGLWLGQIEHLTRGVIFRHVWRQRRAAFGTGRGVMIGDLVGLGGLSQGFTLVTFLPARLSTGAFAQAPHPHRLLQPVARRRLAAVRTVQSEPALEFGNPHFQSRDLDRLRRVKRNKFISPWLWLRLTIHRILESKTVAAV